MPHPQDRLQPQDLPEPQHQDAPGVAHRAPGLQGTASPAERVETDVQASAAAMVAGTGQPAGAGDTHGVDVPSGVPAPGTSEQAGVVQGARTPEAEPAGVVDEPGSSTT